VERPRGGRRHFEQVRADPAIERPLTAPIAASAWAASCGRSATPRARAASWSGAAGADGAAEIVLARAAAQPGPGPGRAIVAGRVADGAGNAREAVAASRRYPSRSISRPARPTRRSPWRRPPTWERLLMSRGQSAKGTAKSISFYDLGAAHGLASFSPARAAPARAGRGRRAHEAERGILSCRGIERSGQQRRGARIRASLLARPQAPAQYRERAPGTSGADRPPPGSGRRGGERLDAMEESSSDPEVLADIVLGCARRPGAVAPRCSRASAQVIEAGDARRYRRLSFALGSYYLGRRNTRAPSPSWRPGATKEQQEQDRGPTTRKCRRSGEAYYRIKKFSEASRSFPR